MYNFADSGEAMTALIPILHADFLSGVGQKAERDGAIFRSICERIWMMRFRRVSRRPYQGQ
jgi:hypothetical protein